MMPRGLLTGHNQRAFHGERVEVRNHFVPAWSGLRAKGDRNAGWGARGLLDLLVEKIALSDDDCLDPAQKELDKRA